MGKEELLLELNILSEKMKIFREINDEQLYNIELIEKAYGNLYQSINNDINRIFKHV